MLGAFEQNAARRGLIQFDHNWEAISREDIYRQRIFGTETGARDFIKVDDQRKLTLVALIFYIIFVIATVEYSTSPDAAAFEVNSAVKKSLLQESYSQAPTRKHWADMEHTTDLRLWLLNAFPQFITPAVQGSNFPIGDIRFTLRRMKTVPYTNKRFNQFVPVVWQDQAGISAQSTSAELDNQTNFGAYREWRSNLADGVSGAVSASSHRFALRWCTKEPVMTMNVRQSHRCPDNGELLDQVELSGMNLSQVRNTCHARCEDMAIPSKPCRCWTLSASYRCQFYYVKDSLLKASDMSTSTCPGLMPDLQVVDGSSTAYWPVMQPFIYDSTGKGYYNSPGFVMNLRYWTQDQINQVAGGNVPPTQSQVLSKQVRDWVDGGLLTLHWAVLTIDFVTYNPNHEVFTWVQLIIEEEASGHISKELKLTSLQITSQELARLASDSSSFASKAWDVIYLGFLLVYVINEFWELFLRGLYYFAVPWNWLTMTSLLFQLLVVITKQMATNPFTKVLYETSNRKFVPDNITFEKQAVDAQIHVRLVALNLLFVWLQMVRYLSDVFPRISVLVDTMHRAMAPIVFLVIIVADVFFGFVVWAHLMFGKRVHSFKTLGASLTCCTELLFGQVEAYYDLQRVYPVTGLVFFFVYMVIFCFVLQNLSKAIVLVSYDDASDSHHAKREEEGKRRKAVLDISSDYITKVWKAGQHHVKKFAHLSGGRGSAEKAKLSMIHYHGGRHMFAFAIFCAMYVSMTYYMLQIFWGNGLTESMTTAFTEPTFETMNFASREVSRQSNLSSVVSREDVTSYMTEVLPQVMFGSSPGTFDGKEHPLKTYHSALPEVFKQLVINNWNIVIGQNPVRITVQYQQMARVSSTAPNERVNAPTTCWVGNTPNWVTSVEGVLENRTRDVLRRRCNYTFAFDATSRTQPNGFSCMLSVDFATTNAILEDMRRNILITNQTTLLAIDFVIYNGMAEAFAYNAVIFNFKPSGAISHSVMAQTIRLERYTSLPSLIRLGLEICVIGFTLYFLGGLFRGVYKTTLDLHTSDGRHQGRRTCLQRVLEVFRGTTLYFVLDPFNVLDLVSCVITLVMMAMWYGVIFMGLSSEFYLPERPQWEQAQCDKHHWCTDDDVIFEFYQAGIKLLWFQRVCACNTVLVFFRMLKYLQIFGRMRVMFNTLIGGAKDISWFIMLMFVVLMGYVYMGWQQFGQTVIDFNSVSRSTITCFMIFLGTYNLSQLQEDEPMGYYYFSYTYMVMFRYVLINMFFAIIDKHFKVEEELRSETNRKKLEQGGQDSEHRGIAFSIRSLLGRAPATALAEGEEQATVDGDPVHSPGTTDAPTSPQSTMPPGEELAKLSEDYGGESSAADMRLGADKVIHEGMMGGARNWKFLPEATQRWALETSRDIYREIECFEEQRAETEQAQEQYEIDRILEEAETKIKDLRYMRAKDALKLKRQLEENELKRLRDVHQDQESLAWYIMKREAELKKLEQTRAMKQARLEKMTQVSRMLTNEE